MTLGAALVFGTTGVIAKLLALPVFCIVILLTSVLSLHLKLTGRRAIVTLLSVKLMLFTIAAVIHGPVSNGDSPSAIGMTLVTAMAIQNGLHRAHLSKLPPTTLMTGTTTQIMIDLADLLSGTETDRLREVKERLRRMATSLLSFAIGCATAAFAFAASPSWRFVVPPALVGLSLLAPSGTPSEA
ncbi:MAG: putative rane protein [Hyphomicrobiales bacterium]|nr:putative rane protein [Hyphomicrobiales bacterium]